MYRWVRSAFSEGFRNAGNELVELNYASAEGANLNQGSNGITWDALQKNRSAHENRNLCSAFRLGIFKIKLNTEAD
jgi:hypothetical protein